MVKLKTIQIIFYAEGLGGISRRVKDRLLSPSYSNWIKQTEKASEASDPQRPLTGAPLISLLVPVYNVEEQWLTLAVDSVLKQSYPHWQLCLADDASTAHHVRPLLEAYAQRDERIHVVFCNTNRGISAATNQALALAKGEFIALLDNDDELAPNALYEVARHLQAFPDTDFIYTDEDHITPKGKRKNPFFKPDWSPDYLHACMYTLHLGVYRTSLVREIGGFRSAYDGAQDWDLALRISEHTSQIHHIPKVLYHWRVLPSSMSSGVDAKPWAYQSAQKALQDMVDRSPYPGWVEEGVKPGLFRVRRHIEEKPLVSILIPSAGTHLTINGKQVCLVEQCLHSIRTLSTYSNIEIVLVDGDDISEKTLSAIISAIKGLDLKLLHCDRPFNFSERMNLAARSAKGDILLILNDDTKVVTPDWIEAMLELAQQKEIGAVGAKLFYPNGRLQHAGILMLAGIPGHAFHGSAGDYSGYHCSSLVTRNYLGITGACLMMRRALFEELGGFDENFDLNYNDVDLCLRAHVAGYRNVFTPYAKLIHYESISRVTGLNEGEIERLQNKFEDTGYMDNDPYYNPNLSTRRPFFQLEWPNRKQTRHRTQGK